MIVRVTVVLNAPYPPVNTPEVQVEAFRRAVEGAVRREIKEEYIVGVFAKEAE